MNKLKKIFGKEKNIIIGAIHFPPLLGYKDYPGLVVALKNALADLRALEAGGVDGIIFENNYDIPHRPLADAGTVSMMTFLGEKIKSATKLPIGINVLWNDYRAGLAIAKILDLQFIRVPVFVDKVKTDYGMIKAEPKKIIKFRKSISAENVALFTDIHVKHAKLLSGYSLITSAELTIKNQSDAIIITGKWTGDAPRTGEIEIVRKHIGDFPILVGSGLDKNNIRDLFQFANGAIVSTSLKTGANRTSEVNLKPYQARIDVKKVKDLIRCL